jgi:hypothetical protein
MKYIKYLESKGFRVKLIVDFLIGATANRKLTIDERKYIADYISDLENKIL